MVPAPQPTWRRLKDPAASQGRGRALSAQHERLAMNRDDRLGEEELGKLGLRRGLDSSVSSSDRTADTSAVPRWSL